MTKQDIKDLYKQITSLYGLKYKTVEDIYEEKTEYSYDHLGAIEHRYKEIVGEREVIKEINGYNVIYVMRKITNGEAELVQGRK